MPEDRPFFVAVGFRLPHVPCFASQKWFDLYPEETVLLPEVRADDRDDVPAFSWYLHWKLPEPRLSWLKRANQWRPLVRAYLASTSFMDSQVGRVLDALDATGRAKETVVVLWSDHGWHLGEKGITGKNSLWERSTRVPLIIAGPGVSAGATCARARGAARHLPDADRALRPDAPRAVSTATASCPSSRTRTPHVPGRPSQRTTAGTIRSARSAGGISVTPTAPRNSTTTATTQRMEKPGERPTARGCQARAFPLAAGPGGTPAPGSAIRLLNREDGIWYWEGKPIVPGEYFPSTFETKTPAAATKGVAPSSR